MSSDWVFPGRTLCDIRAWPSGSIDKGKRVLARVESTDGPFGVMMRVQEVDGKGSPVGSELPCFGMDVELDPLSEPAPVGGESR